MKSFHVERKYFSDKNIEKALICINTIIYLIILYLLKNNLEKHRYIIVYKFTLETNVLGGILVEIQMLLSVFLSLRKLKTGYTIALLLNGYGFFLKFIDIFIEKKTHFIPSMISYMGVILIVSLIYRYKSSVNEQMNKIEIQNKNILKSEERYQKQNTQLLNQNRILKEKEKELKQIVFFDDLTNILNRKIFVEELNIQIEFIKDSDKNLYVVFIDIDNFKMINDTMGHHVGDYVLREVTKRIKSQMHEEDIIGRLGGDEIGMLINRNIENKELYKYINGIRKEIMKSFVIDNQKFQVTASFGIATFPEDGIDSVSLLRRADVSMYYSKSKGKNQITFSNKKDYTQISNNKNG
jgi:diguanylate cyclase (GGDEF)-like protein